MYFVFYSAFFFGVDLYRSFFQYIIRLSCNHALNKLEISTCWKVAIGASYNFTTNIRSLHECSLRFDGRKTSRYWSFILCKSNNFSVKKTKYSLYHVNQLNSSTYLFIYLQVFEIVVKKEITVFLWRQTWACGTMGQTVVPLSNAHVEILSGYFMNLNTLIREGTSRETYQSS